MVHRVLVRAKEPARVLVRATAGAGKVMSTGKRVRELLGAGELGAGEGRKITTLLILVVGANMSRRRRRRTTTKNRSIIWLWLYSSSQ